jgi:predicted dehydrogenase
VTAFRRYRGVVLGAGNVARTAHCPAFEATPLLRQRLVLAGGVDSRPGLPPLGTSPVLASREEIPSLGAIDFVDICTPTASHVELALWALEHGYHVLCEKPVAVTAEEAERLADASRRAQRVLYPCHQYRFNPAWLRARAWLDEGRIGRWHLAEFRVYRPHADPGSGGTGTAWRGQGALSRGGVLLDHGSHLLYLILDVAGPPRAVHAWSGTLRHAAYDVEDTVALSLEYPDRLVTLFLTWAGYERETLIRFFGERGVIEWVGGGLRLAADGSEERLDMSAQLLKSSYPSWFARLLERFVAAMDAGASAPALSEIAAVAGLLERAYEAAGAARGVRAAASEPERARVA